MTVFRIEAATLGCFPLCPKRLSYPEIFPIECLYKTEAQLVKKLAYFCKNPYATRNFQPDLEKFTWKSLKSTYEELLFNQANVNTLSGKVNKALKNNYYFSIICSSSLIVSAILE